MLNISEAVTEPYLNYHLFHENLNTRVKVLTASLNQVIELLMIPGNENKMSELIKAADESWQYPPSFSLPEPKVTFKTSKRKMTQQEMDDTHEKLMRDKKRLSQEMLYCYVSELAIFGSFSALDDCFVDINATIDSWDHFKQIHTSRVAFEHDDKLTKFYGSFGWDISGIAKYLPIFNYFRAIRNSVAHRNSKASPVLESISRSAELKDSVAKMFSAGEPLPEFLHNETIYIRPKTTLLCSHIIREICKDMNKHLIGMLGAEGLIFMACNHAFNPAAYDEVDKTQLAKARLNDTLNNRYHITLKGDDVAVKLAVSIGVWSDCSKLHSARMRVLNPKF